MFEGGVQEKQLFCEKIASGASFLGLHWLGEPFFLWGRLLAVMIERWMLMLFGLEILSFVCGIERFEILVDCLFVYPRIEHLHWILRLWKAGSMSEMKMLLHAAFSF